MSDELEANFEHYVEPDPEPAEAAPAIDLAALQPHPLCRLMNEKHPLRRIGIDAHARGTDEAGVLTMSIASFGIRRRVVIDAATGQVLDGWNSLQTWLQVRDAQGEAVEPIEPHLERVKFADERARLNFVLGAQLGRRNLSAGQRAALYKELSQLEGGAPGAPSLESLAKISKTSKRTVKQVARVYREGSPELQAAVAAGQVSAKTAEALLSKSKVEQTEIVNAGPEAVAQARREAVEAREAKREPAAPPHLEAAYVVTFPPDRAAFFRRHMDEALAAATPEQLANMLPLAWEAAIPEQRAAVVGERMNGAVGNVDLLKQSDRVKRKTRDGDTLELCNMIERAVQERSVAMRECGDARRELSREWIGGSDQRVCGGADRDLPLRP